MTSVHDFGAAGDGQRDDTAAIQHALRDGEGLVDFPRGDYVISRPIDLKLSQIGRTAIVGSGGTAKIIMKGPGPAFRLIGNHVGTADPASMKPEIWRRQRMATLAEIEIEGAHPEADGVELSGAVQPIIRNVGLHRLRHGIRLVGRNRNVIIDGCQIYHNTGVGIYLDGVNLHQINIFGNHVSYNRLGGIRIERSEVRNLQITGNDIEYNTDRTHKIKEVATAEIYIDCTAENATVNEVTIASNTIQATPSQGGANLRIMENGNTSGRPPGLFAITGNVIGNQTNNVHLSGCYGITLSGNNIYSAKEHNLLIDGGCRQIIVAANQFRRHTPNLGTGIHIAASYDCIVSGCHVIDESADGQVSGKALLSLENCQRVTLNACQLIGSGTTCLELADCKDVSVGDCTLFAGTDAPKGMSLSCTGNGFGNIVHHCRIRDGSRKHQIQEKSGVKFESNYISD